MGSLIKARKPSSATVNATPWRDSSEAQLTSEEQSSGGREAPRGQSHQSQHPHNRPNINAEQTR